VAFLSTNVPPPTPFSPPSLHDALPISLAPLPNTSPFRVSLNNIPILMASWLSLTRRAAACVPMVKDTKRCVVHSTATPVTRTSRSEEHTSELQSRENLVCRLLLEKKKK